MNSEAIAANLVSGTQRVNGELDISQSNVVCPVDDLASSAAELCLTLPKYCQTFHPL